MSLENGELTCYNKGCGKRYTEEENNDDSCSYHPGVPIFHDAMKGWSCCKKMSTDFTTFLSTPGCTIGRHSNVKPAEPQKTTSQPLSGEVNKEGMELQRKKKPPMERPSGDLPMMKLHYTVVPSLTAKLKKIAEEQASKPKEEVREEDEDEIQIGTKCKNMGCDQEYHSTASNLTDCIHHPGGPVFHDGYRYWSCCQRRTSDFNEFLKQEGCTSGRHVWKIPKDDKRFKYCRRDWHQTGGHVIISMFAKNCDPQESSVEANQTKMSMRLSSNGKEKEYDVLFDLYGAILPEKSEVEYMIPKVEIRLTKADICSWPTLEIQKPKEAPQQSS